MTRVGWAGVVRPLWRLYRLEKYFGRLILAEILYRHSTVNIKGNKLNTRKINFLDTNDRRKYFLCGLAWHSMYVASYN